MDTGAMRERKKLEWCGTDVYRWLHPNGKYRYYVIEKCSRCGKPFLKDKYSKQEYCSMKCKGVSKGRPINHKLRQESIDKISNSSMGRHHSKETKDKISDSLTGGSYHWNPERLAEWKENHPWHVTGKAHPKYRHGMTNKTMWIKWMSIKGRCYNHNSKNYGSYGEKGVRVCEEWQEFIPFMDWCLMNGWKYGLHLHRIDMEKDYNPTNCLFVSPNTHSSIHATMRKLGITRIDDLKIIKDKER